MSPAYNRATPGQIMAALEAAEGNVANAAKALGIKTNCLRQKMHRAGIVWRDLDDIRLRGIDQMREQFKANMEPPAGDAALTTRGVYLSLGDYALLQSRAALWAEAERLQTELDQANRIIVSLTRAVEQAGA